MAIYLSLYTNKYLFLGNTNDPATKKITILTQAPLDDGDYFVIYGTNKIYDENDPDKVVETKTERIPIEVTGTNPYFITVLTKEFPDMHSVFVEGPGDIEPPEFAIIPELLNLGIVDSPPLCKFSIIVNDERFDHITVRPYVNFDDGRYVQCADIEVPVNHSVPNIGLSFDIARQVCREEIGEPLEPLWKHMHYARSYSVILHALPRNSAPLPQEESPSDFLIQHGHPVYDKLYSSTFIFFKGDDPNNVDYHFIVTALGEKKIAQALLENRSPVITEAGIDDGGGHPFIPNKNMTRLINEVYRTEIADAVVDGNIIRFKVVLGPQVGNFWVRGMGLFDSDGDLIAITNYAAIEKRSSTTGLDMKVVLQANLMVTDAGAFEIHIDPKLNTVDHIELREYLLILERKLLDDLEAHNQYTLAHPPLRLRISALEDAVFGEDEGESGGGTYQGGYYDLDNGYDGFVKWQIVGNVLSGFGRVKLKYHSLVPPEARASVPLKINGTMLVELIVGGTSDPVGGAFGGPTLRTVYATPDLRGILTGFDLVSTGTSEDTVMFQFYGLTSRK